MELFKTAMAILMTKFASLEKTAISYEQMAKYVYSPYKKYLKVAPKAIVVRKAENAADNEMINTQIIKYLKDKFMLRTKDNNKATVLKLPEAKKLEQKLTQIDMTPYNGDSNFSSYPGNAGGYNDRVRHKYKKNSIYTNYNI